MVYNFRAQPSDLLANPASLEWISSRKAAGDVVLSFVGSLSERKNIHGLVSALAEAPSLSLVLCGQGPLSESLEAFVRSNALEDRVRFEGQVLVSVGHNTTHRCLGIALMRKGSLLPSLKQLQSVFQLYCPISRYIASSRGSVLGEHLIT